MENGNITGPCNGALLYFRRAELSLKEASSVSQFESTAIDSFVRDLATALQAVLAEHSSQKGCVISHNAEELQFVLTSDIDWMGLMLHYDRQRVTCSAATASQARTTPLDLVLQALTESPTIFPVACHDIVLRAGWLQIVNYCAKARVARFRDNGDFLTRAQRHVWSALLRLRRKSPALWKHVTLPRVDVQSTTVLRQCETLLGMLQEVRQKQCTSDRVILDAALRLLRQSESFLAPNNNTNNPEPPAKRMRRKIQYNPFEASHDDDGIPEDPEALCIPKIPAIRETREASLPQLLQQKSKIIEAKTNGATVGDGERWKEWREQVFDFAMSCSRSGTCSNRDLVDQIWSVVLENVDQSSLLLFFLVKTLSTGCKTLREWIRSLLKLAQASGKQSCFYPSFALRCYSELVAELAIFDELAELQSITTPFFGHLLENHMNGHCPDSSLSWKRAFVFILSRRAVCLDAIPHFASVKTSISLSWSSVEDWVDPNMSPNEQTHTITTLYQAGILGVCEAMEYSVKTSSESSKCDEAQEWPFAELKGIRMASRHCRKYYHSRELFSKHVPRVGAQKSDPAELGDFVQNFLHGDILLRVFGYLGFKRMAQVNLVCREWNRLANHPRLWQSFFQKRYGIAEDDPVRKDPDQPWKTYFHHRFIVEQEVRSRGSTSAKKLRVCKFVGCNTIVSTLLQLTRHHASHERKTAKKVKKQAAEKKALHKRRQPAPKSARKKPPSCPNQKEPDSK